MISIVSPVYNSEACLQTLVKKITFYSKKITSKFEIILVDDGSQDNSWKKIVELKKKYKFIKGVKLYKNYGQHVAIYQGIKLSTKKLIIVMDCDLQDNPAYIVEMYKAYIKYKKPIIIRHSYKNFKLKDRIVSNIFWYFLSAISFKNFSPSLGNYLLIDNEVKKKYFSISRIGYLYGDLIAQGNNFLEIEKKRFYGIRNGTTYNIQKLICLGVNLIFKYNILSFFLNNPKVKIKKIQIEKIL